jgi:hypothetical protein
MQPNGLPPVVHLAVKRRSAETHAVVLSVDEAGTASWHTPRPQRRSPSRAAAASAAVPPLEFEIPWPISNSAGRGVSPQGVIGKLGRRILKVVFYKAADVAVGKVGKYLFSEWEKRHRPTHLRWFSPDNYQQARADLITTPSQLSGLRDQTALLFIHGTFSTSHGGFGGVPKKTMTELYKRYGTRVLAFDHATMASSPELNLKLLQENLQGASGTTFDVISHSRGGFVARGLAGEFGAGSTNLSVRRAVLVAAPNHGTALADVDHLSDLLDRMTTALSLIPPLGPVGFITETLETVITAVKFIGSSVARRLEGLIDMSPTSDFLRVLNTGTKPTAAYYGVSSNFEPHETGLLALIRGHIVDSTVDWVFGKAANDLVVPQLGVSQGPPPDDPVFPLKKASLKAFGSQAGVWHCNYFEQPETSTALLDWLTRP